MRFREDTDQLLREMGASVTIVRDVLQLGQRASQRTATIDVTVPGVPNPATGKPAPMLVRDKYTLTFWRAMSEGQRRDHVHAAVLRAQLCAERARGQQVN